MSQKTLEFFYDFSSPYAYLAHEEAERVSEGHGATLVYRPFFLGGLFKSLESALVPIHEASEQKRKWLSKDIGRWAEIREMPFQWPTQFPMNTITALRVVLQLLGDENAEAHRRVCRAIFRAYWADDLNISDPEVLAKVLDSADVDAVALLTKTREPQVKALLFSATEEALERGAVGAPTFFVDDLCFWGQDRFEMVSRALQGWRPKGG
mgnify:CR=1 FL=1